MGRAIASANADRRRRRYIQLRAEGLSLAEIAAELGVCYRTVRRYRRAAADIGQGDP